MTMNAELLQAGAPPAPHYELDQPCLAATDHAVLLAEFARSRGLALPPLAGSISPRRLLELLAPLQAQGGPDAAFVIGRHWLPGHYGLASQALQEAPDLVEALRLLCAHAGRLTPLLTPRLLLDGERELVLVWTEACGLPPGDVFGKMLAAPPDQDASDEREHA